jgi:Cu/Zn superoxide dismutase
MSAVCVMKGTEGVSGTITITEADGTVTLKGKLEGLKPGLHGFHIHQLGDTTNGCALTARTVTLASDLMPPLAHAHAHRPTYDPRLVDRLVHATTFPHHPGGVRWDGFFLRVIARHS